LNDGILVLISVSLDEHLKQKATQIFSSTRKKDVVSKLGDGHRWAVFKCQLDLSVHIGAGCRDLGVSAWSCFLVFWQ